MLEVPLVSDDAELVAVPGEAATVPAAVLLKAFAATAAERAEFSAKERLAEIARSGMW